MKSLALRLLQSVLAWEAAIFRARYTGPMIAITGSNGKTSTKEAIGYLLKKAYGEGVVVTPKSFNAELGVPLTLLGFRSAPSQPFGWLFVPIKGLVTAFFSPLPKCIVLELAADHPGDIAYLGRLVQPTHAIITNISEAHSAFLGDLASIRAEKTSLLQFVSLDGTIILNGDDEHLAKYSVKGLQKKILVRLHKRADYFASNIKVTLEGTESILHHANRTQRLRIPRYGEHQLYSILFAAAVADSLGINPSLQVQAFRETRPVQGRGMLIAGKKGSYILDESYNGQPAAMRASIELLREMPAKRRVAILGDMRELANPEPIHQEIGKRVREIADYVIAVGPMSKAYKADEWFMTAEEAIPSALRQLGSGVIVLVKGSQNTIRLERVVKSIMADPSQAKQLLVRQEESWLKKN